MSDKTTKLPVADAVSATGIRDVKSVGQKQNRPLDTHDPTNFGSHSEMSNRSNPERRANMSRPERLTQLPSSKSKAGNGDVKSVRLKQNKPLDTQDPTNFGSLSEMSNRSNPERRANMSRPERPTQLTSSKSKMGIGDGKSLPQKQNKTLTTQDPTNFGSRAIAALRRVSEFLASVPRSIALKIGKFRPERRMSVDKRRDAEIAELRQKINTLYNLRTLDTTKYDADIAELKRQRVLDNKKRDAENAEIWQAFAEIRQENAELRQENAELKKSDDEMNKKLVIVAEILEKHGYKIKLAEKRIAKIQVDFLFYKPELEAILTDLVNAVLRLDHNKKRLPEADQQSKLQTFEFKFGRRVEDSWQ